VPKYNPIKSTKITIDKTCSIDAYTKKLFPYLRPFLSNSSLEKTDGKHEKIKIKYFPR